MRVLSALVLLLVAGACGPHPTPSVRSISLDGGWTFRATTDTAWLPAIVPGTVHTDLLAAGRIPDPFTGTGREEELRWVEETGWHYRRTFDVVPGFLDEEHQELVFQGLDTWATVLLNGRVILTADNMFRSWRVDVAGILRAGTNTLEVRFQPPVEAGARRAAAHPWPIPHQEPDAGGTRAFSRKAAYHFGWDWGPRFVTSGIWRPVSLEGWSGIRIVDVYPMSVRWEGGTAVLGLAVEVRGTSRGKRSRGGGEYRVGIRSPDGAFSPSVQTLPAPPDGGVATFGAEVTIPDAEPWWPRGMGRPPGRQYSVDVDVVGGGRWDQRVTRVGLRTVELVTTPDTLDGVPGESFLFQVNGTPVFARGANVVPPDHFTPSADSAAYAQIVRDAVDANMNMLRVWGGGVYLPDVFYDLADAAGILVWQDFMFANTLVPEDPDFVASVASEAADQVRRLRSHPSLALWCGNNEVAEGWANWGWRDAYTSDVAQRVEAAYRRIFLQVLPTAVERYDHGTAYVPSSPRLGWGDPESLNQGDSHYWGVWWGNEPFRAYADKVPRFASEFGFQALPDPRTLQAFREGASDPTAEADHPPLPGSLTAPTMLAHQKHPTGYETIRRYLEREWPVPPDDSVEAWSYVSQVAQADGVGLALEAHRRSWPRTGGTLFWQLNDTWPVVSWSSVDHFGRWKALQHRAKDIFAPLAVLADVQDDTVAVWVAADVPGDAAGTLHIRLRHLRGPTLGETRVDIRGPGLAWRGTVADLLPPDAASPPPEELWIETVLDPEGPGPAPRDVAFLVPPRALRLSDPHVEVVSVDTGPDGAWSARITADAFAFAVSVSPQDGDARVTPDFFHLAPGDTVTVHLTTGPPGLRLRSLFDVMGSPREPGD